MKCSVVECLLNFRDQEVCQCDNSIFQGIFKKRATVFSSFKDVA